MRYVVLISGAGSNLLKILQAAKLGLIEADVSAVISNKASAKGLQHAQAFGIAQHVLEQSAFASREMHDLAIAEVIDSYKPDYIILAGYMRILSTEFIQHFDNRIINIHPSLLPLYKGLNTHQRAIDDKQAHHGCSIHMVTPELDSGQILAQAQVAIDADDTAESLADKVHVLEHQLYPLILRYLSTAELKLTPNVTFKNELLDPQGLQYTQQTLLEMSRNEGFN